MLLILFNIVVACAQIQSRYHTVKASETIGQLAKQYGVPEDKIWARNDTLLVNGIQPGSRIFIPFEASPEWDTELKSDVFRNAELDVDRHPVALPNFVWPVAGFVSSRFGMRSGTMHDGIDVVAPEGATVKSARSGHVIYAHDRIGGYGRMIIVRHPDSYSTVYAHLSSITVRKGQFVAKGQLIGKVGQTGHARGPHLHFEIRNYRIPVNPLLYLQVQVATNILRR